MSFISLTFVIFLISFLFLYYITTPCYRYVVLLMASLAFYAISTPKALPILLATAALSYGAGRLLYLWRAKEAKQQKLLLGLSILCILLPWLIVKNLNYLLLRLSLSTVSILVPLGISFYTLQIIAYLVDIYRGKITPEENFFRYLLFISYFPQILQGPIPRFSQLSTQLHQGKKFNETTFMRGFLLILWGLFLKLVIADRAVLVVDPLFATPFAYPGFYALIAGCLYCIQLYADFMGCVYMAQGVSELFGITLADNFRRPFMAETISDLWSRWHISLSSWLKDYVYISLGGNRKGKWRKYFHLILTFLASALWHGTGFRYIAWGLIHGCLQVIGDLAMPLRRRAADFFHLKKGDLLLTLYRRLVTFLAFMVAVVIFRANSLREGLWMIASFFTTHNYCVLYDGSMLAFGLTVADWIVLLVAVLLLTFVGVWQEHHQGYLRDVILARPLLLRGAFYLFAIMIILVFGTYGYGFSAQDFIYGGF